MRCEATFLEKRSFRKCYVTDRNINFAGLGWIDELNIIQFPDESQACQTPTLEPTDAEILTAFASKSKADPTMIYLASCSLPPPKNPETPKTQRNHPPYLCSGL
ncbi:unnamed protein product [Hymenolepis diminuta]|uniref:Uncharacterized protein n=1 Tax=Hymenolepis diminuta TaxID=6216 RepID=A0A564YYS3_HYMDI|nr:unnamed protein product [Hymenolepis diminuta]